MFNIKQNDNVEVFYSIQSKIPFNLIKEEISGGVTAFQKDLIEIAKAYDVYYNGTSFTTEGSGGDYIPAQLRYKRAAQLINKEARFMFSMAPDINITYDGNIDKASDDISDTLDIYRKLVKNVFKKASFFKRLSQGARDCFIGKRIAIMLNFNEVTGITINFYDAFSFVYESSSSNTEELTKLAGYTIVKESDNANERRIFKKKYELIDGIVWFEDILYDGTGKEIEVVNEFQESLLTEIPGVVIINEGLLGDTKGDSDIEQITDYEGMYSKLSNADIDAERKGMNQIRYTIDMDSNTTSKLPAGPGAYWDLMSDQNVDNAHPAIGTLQTNLDYSGSLDTTLKRISSSMYDQLEVPDITPENISGLITSGKGLKAVYWPLSVRCDEKMMAWKIKLEYLVECIINGALIYPNCASKYIGNDVITAVMYEVEVVRNSPILEDEAEEKQVDLAEVQTNTLSKKSYMQKWRQLTDDEVDKELKQIALEREILEDSYMNPMQNFNKKEDNDI